MSSEHATEQVPLAEIQEGDTVQDPESGQWFTVTRTADGTTSVIHKQVDGDTTVIEGYRVYTATNKKANRSIPGASSIRGPLKVLSLGRCGSNRERPRDRIVTLRRCVQGAPSSANCLSAMSRRPRLVARVKPSRAG
jgi:hypothetical protein